MTTYFADEKIIIRSMIKEDALAIIDVFHSYGWGNQVETYLQYYHEQEIGKRKVYIAEVKGELAGFCTLIMLSKIGPWKDTNVTEISDLRVFNKIQRNGIGDLLLSVIINDVSKFSSVISLSVGLHSGHGSAQRKYVKSGYVLDGSGVWYDTKVLDQYATTCNDDSLVLYMRKKLRN